MFIYRVPTEEDHVLKSSGLRVRHYPCQAAAHVIEARQKIREAIESEPLSFVTVIYEKCVAEMLSSIRLSG